MGETMVVRAVDIVGSSHCVSVDDGLRLHDTLLGLLQAGGRVTLSFEKAETVISAFLNAAVGKLFGDLPSEEVDARLQVKEVNPDLLARVRQNAIRYYSDPATHSDVVRRVTGDAG